MTAAASPRATGPGERGLPALQRVLQRRAGQRARCTRSAMPPGASPTTSWPSSSWPRSAVRNASTASSSTVTTWLPRVGERGVIERPGLLPDPERLTADLEHQRLGHGIADVVGRGDAEARPGEPDDVLVGTRERHRGVDRQRDAAELGQRGQHADAVGAGGVHDDGARPHRSGGRQTRRPARRVRRRGSPGSAARRGRRRPGRAAPGCRGAGVRRAAATRGRSRCRRRRRARPVPGRRRERYPPGRRR